MIKRRLVAVAILALAPLGARAQQVPQERTRETLRAKLDPALPAYQPSGSVSDKIRIAGNIEHMEALINLWIGAFTKRHPKAQFSLDSNKSDSGKAVSALVEGTPDITLIGRPPTRPKEIADFERKYGYRPFVVAVAGGSYRIHGKSFAPVFFVNQANPIDKLSFDQLDAIYSKTRKRGFRDDITTWGQLGLKGEWAKRPITLYGVPAVAGTAVFLREYLLEGGPWKEGIKEVKYVDAEADWNEMVNEVANDATGIGYASSDHVSGNRSVKTLALAEKEGAPYYQGTFENVVSHRYPLSRFVFVILNRAPGKSIDPKVKEFLRFVLSKEGQEAVQKEGDYLPLPAGIVKLERAKLE